MAKRWISKKYREAYVWASIRDGLAFQIRLMREDRGWTQAELAERLGTGQSAISRLEDPDSESPPSVSTLERLASVFDVGLFVRFVDFRELDEYAQNLSRAKIAPAPFRGLSE